MTLHPDFPRPESPPESVTESEYKAAWESRYGKGEPYGENPNCFLVDAPIPCIRDDGTMYASYFYVQYFCPVPGAWRKRTRDFAKHVLEDYLTIGMPVKPSLCEESLTVLKGLTQPSKRHK